MTEVSVISVVRNNLAGLRRTISSLDEQDRDVFEHIVVDGASSDGTVQFLSRHEPQYQFSFVSEQDDGLYDAMNKGIRRASGDVVLFLNGADLLADPGVLGRVARDRREHQWQWAFGSINFIDAANRVVGSHTGRPYSMRTVLLGRSYVPHPAAFVSTQTLIELGGFDPSFGLSADQELMMRVARKSEPRLLDMTVTNMEIGGAHSTSRPKETARRYQKIRKSHDALVANSLLVDTLYTVVQGALWQSRQSARERLLGRPRF